MRNGTTGTDEEASRRHPDVDVGAGAGDYGNLHGDQKNTFQMRSLNRDDSQRRYTDADEGEEEDGDDEARMVSADSLAESPDNNNNDSDVGDDEASRYGYTKTATWQTTANLIKSIVGVGIFGE